jgi:hypothetical protein
MDAKLATVPTLWQLPIVNGLLSIVNGQWSMVNGQWSTGLLVYWSTGQTGQRVYRVHYPAKLSKSFPNRSKVVYLTGKKEPCRLSGDSRQGGQVQATLSANRRE